MSTERKRLKRVVISVLATEPMVTSVESGIMVPVLEQEFEARGGAKARDGRDVERKHDRLGNRDELPLQGRENSPDVQRGPVALLPRLEPDENGAEVRLVGVRDEAEPADRREG